MKFFFTILALPVILFSNEIAENDAQKIYEKENHTLKEESLQFAPDKKKNAYFQEKFVSDIKSLGDKNYMSLIVNDNGKLDTVFQNDFHLSYFEWLNNNEILVHHDCGSPCEIDYRVNVYTKKYREISVEY